ncbi:hypothetical protein [Vibrio sp. LaRot3]|uniref:hypothetical protein n=1 Tax=Vibrio sp. LaRot3 TaxID=2998829 RepID=UPI0022CDDE68|nr:hypothetical protein [Vibrio sp. LaRot3]MDA0148850.1 hypothetical protein [Vibrio sp. LaRot3]
MPNDTKSPRKPHQTRKAKAPIGKSKTATQTAAAPSQPSDVQSQVVGHYQAVLPPTNHPNTNALNTVLTAARQGDNEPLLISVRSTQKRGFWRCGLFFSDEGTTLGVHPKDDEEHAPFLTEDGVELVSVTYEQYQRLVSEPRLEVEEL